MDTLNKTRIIRIFPDTVALFQAAAADFMQRAREAVAARGVFSVILSGGNTAKFFFDALVASEQRQPDIPWPQIKFFFGDERYVPADDAQSNYLSAHEHLFSKVPVATKNIYRIPTEFSDPNVAAENYAATIRQVTKFDLVYLGLGEDGHTASLMPNSDIVKAYAANAVLIKRDPLVTALWVPKLKMYRITLTPAALNHSACICFLVTGTPKALAVRDTLEGPQHPEQYPAQLIQCVDEPIIWYLDLTAAEKLL